MKKKKQSPTFCMRKVRTKYDSKRKREPGHGGEAGVLQQLAKGEFEVVHDLSKKL